MRVLIVEDELIHQRLLLRLLENFATCDVAVDGVEALQLFERNLDEEEKYALILLDVMMPKLDGLGVLKRLRMLEQQAGIPAEKRVKIMMITALADRAAILRAAKEGCDSYLIKPFSRRDLFRKLEELGFHPK
jgi:two-component system chemotaxis response regulator CheY